MVESTAQPEQKAPSRSLQVVIYLLLAGVVCVFGNEIVRRFAEAYGSGRWRPAGEAVASTLMTITFVLTFVAPSSWVNAKREWFFGTMVLSAVILLLSQLL